MKIDAHQHFWNYDPQQYAWMQPEWSIRRDFGPHDLKPLLDQAQIDGCIAVQAQQTLAETNWLLSLSQAHPWIRGVVGWIDLQCEDIAPQLQQFQHRQRLVGVRHVVQDEPDDRFLLRPAFLQGIEQLASHNLTYDILIYPKQLPAAIELVRQFPHQPFVLDHLAKPFIKKGELETWRTQIQALAAYPNLCCKVSGMVTEADWTNWKAKDFQPFLQVVLEAFGADRLLYGSDWPVALLAASYPQVYQLIEDFVHPLSETERASILGDNAVRFYGLRSL